jgi:hypothetical protein
MRKAIRCDNSIGVLVRRLDPGAVLEYSAIGLRLDDAAARWHAAREPNVAADDRSLADRHTSEHRRSGVDHDVVLDDRMTRLALDQRACTICRQALGAERYRLIEADAFANDRRLADDDTCPVIDKEVAADLRPLGECLSPSPSAPAQR